MAVLAAAAVAAGSSVDENTGTAPTQRLDSDEAPQTASPVTPDADGLRVQQRTQALDEADELQVLAPVALDAPELSLGEAVRLTMLYSPRVQSAKQDIASSIGQLRQAAGDFDHTLAVAPGLSWFNRELTDSELSQVEIFRIKLETTAEVFSQLNQELVQALEQDRRGPVCPDDVDFANDSIVVGGDAFATDLIIRIDGVDIDAVCDTSDTRFSRRVLEAASANNVDLAALLEQQRSDLAERRRTLFGFRSEVAEEIATKAALALVRLGALPDDVRSKEVSIDILWFKLFRNGLSLRGDISLKSQGDNFDDKPLDPTFGALPFQNRFPNIFSLALRVPIGKGRGVATSGPENAAKAAVEARRDQLRHLISVEVFRTTLSYLNVIATLDIVRFLEESAQRHRDLVEITEDLIAADEVPAVQIDRVRAQTAGVLQSVASARLELLEGRFGLADTIGLNVETLATAPLPSDGFTDDVSREPDSEALIDVALDERRDTLALSQALDAQQFLTNAARADLKRRIDFTATGGMTTFYESPFFRFLPDELDVEDRPTESPLRFYNPRGFIRSLNRDYKPFFRVQLTFDLPFKNNVAKGRLLREQSLLTLNQIGLTDLERTVRNKVIEVRGTLDRAAAALLLRRETVAHYDDTLDSARARYQSGDITIVDMLITEEDLLREQLELVRDLQVYLSILARLRFETGTLITYEQENTSLEFAAFDPSSFVVP